MKDTHREEVLSDLLVLLAVCAVVLSAIGAFGYNIALASTQWLLVSTVLLLFAIYFQIKK